MGSVHHVSSSTSCPSPRFPRRERARLPQLPARPGEVHLGEVNFHRLILSARGLSLSLCIAISRETTASTPVAAAQSASVARPLGL
jgi:hypothetical protein